MVCWWWILLALVCLKESNSLPFLKNIFVGHRILAWQFFSFSTLRCCSTVFWLELFSMISLSHSNLDVIFLSLAAFKMFLFVTGLNFIMIYPGENFFMFLMLAVCWVSWICGFIVVIKLRNFSSVIFFRFFSVLLLHFSVFSYMYIKLLEVVSQITDALMLSCCCLFLVCISCWIVFIVVFW